MTKVAQLIDETTLNPKQLVAHHILERKRCERSFGYFVDSYAMMYKKEGGEPIPFKLWEFQIEGADLIQLHKRLIILKARQMGLSWLAMAYAVWCILFKKNFHVYITSIGLKEVNEQMERIRFIWYNLPEHIRGDVILGGRGLKDNDSIMETSNGSAVHAISSSKASGHGTAPGLYILDEFARKEGDRLAWRAISPSLGEESRVIVISTSNGIGNLFAELWFDAVANNNGFYPLFFAASRHPDYTESYLAAKKAEFAGDMQGYHEAFPMVPEDAFMSTKRSVFPMERIREWKEEARKHTFQAGVIEMSDKMCYQFKEEPLGNIMVWELPVPGHHYALGADVSEGLVEGDYSASAILDVDTNEIVALFRGKIETEYYANIIQSMARFYNNAWVVVEVNKASELIIQDLKVEYPWLYCRQQRAHITDLPTLVPGFYATSTSKPRVVLQMKRQFASTEKPLAIYSDIILDEMAAYEKDARGRYGAAGNHHDDTVSATYLAVEGSLTIPYTDSASMVGGFSTEADLWGRRRALDWRSL